MLTVTVTVFGFLIATIAAYKGYHTSGGALEVGQSSTVPLVSRGTLVAANQIPPPFVDICHVETAFQFPEAALLNSSLAEFAVLIVKKKIVRTEKILSKVSIFKTPAV